MSTTPAPRTMATDSKAREGFWPDLGRIVVLAAVVRLAYVVIFRRHPDLSTDPAYYHEAANLLADGKGFVSPYAGVRGRSIPAADHPPLFTVYLAAFSFLGVRGVTGHALAASALGLLLVVLGALVARELAGDGAGLVAAFILALYPGAWTYNGGLFAETAAMVVVASVLLAALRLARSPSWRWAAAAGALVGLGALSRSELALLGVFAVGPAVLGGHARVGKWKQGEEAERKQERDPGVITTKQGLGLLAVAALAAFAVISPWALYNTTRFDDPVLLSSQAGLTLSGANCDRTYSGPLMGYWSVSCATAAFDEKGADRLAIDQSAADRQMRRAAFTYIGDHLGRLPLVMAARVARVAGVMPFNQVPLDIDHEGRDSWVAWASALTWYPLAALGIVGAVRLWRRGRRRQVVIMLAPAAVVLVAVALFFGLTRYRAPADVSFAILAAVGLVGVGRSASVDTGAPANVDLAKSAD